MAVGRVNIGGGGKLKNYYLPALDETRTSNSTIVLATIPARKLVAIYFRSVRLRVDKSNYHQYYYNNINVRLSNVGNVFGLSTQDGYKSQYFERVIVVKDSNSCWVQNDDSGFNERTGNFSSGNIQILASISLSTDNTSGYGRINYGSQDIQIITK